jgi:hypothetical protein
MLTAKRKNEIATYLLVDAGFVFTLGVKANVDYLCNKVRTNKHQITSTKIQTNHN